MSFMHKQLCAFRIGNNLAFAHVAQLAEHVLGKDEVISSILIMGSSPENGKMARSPKILQVIVKT